MPPIPARHFILFLLSVWVTTASCEAPERYTTVVDVEPIVDYEVMGQSGDPNFPVMLASYQNHGPVHAMSYYGDFDEFVEQHHQQLLEYLSKPQAALEQRHDCSMFQYHHDAESSIVGRNFDNVFTDLLVGWFFPQRGYASIAFVPLFELGFNKENRFDLENPQHRQVLLNAPIVSIEGVNEHGVTVTLASLDRRKVKQMPDREPRFLIHLVREILDHAATVEEAVGIASRYNVFDNGREVISHHIFVAGPRSGSVVLEWKDGQMHVVPDGDHWQIVTNSELLAVSEQQRRRNCSRYETIYEQLSEQIGALPWTSGMDALARAAQDNRVYVLDGERRRISTQWSAIFDLQAKEVRVCLHRDFSKVYRFRFPEPPG